MTELPTPGSPARRFVDDLTDAGTPVWAEPGRLMYEVLAVGGVLAGQWIVTGVSLVEVQRWPQVPPHWVHLPDTVAIEATNSDSSDCPPGWLRHSRGFALTDMSIPPARAWLSHVRGLLSLAVVPAGSR